jgi:nitroreductase
MTSINILNEIIRTRRAVFPPSFKTGEEIPDDVLHTILENANWAPTHKRTEPWRFIVFRKQGLFRLADWMIDDYLKHSGEAFSEMKAKKIRQKILQSCAVIAIVMQRHEESGLPEWEEIAAVSCAVQNLWLSAHAHGLGGYWSTPGTINRIGKFLKLSIDQRCLGYFYLGIPNESDIAEGKREPVTDKIIWRDV